MARKSRVKSGTFFLRTGVTTNGVTFATDSIDISSFINVLDGELLRVKRVWWSWQSSGGGPILGADLGASKGCSAFAGLSTEKRTQVGGFTNNDNISLNRIYVHTDSNADIDMITNETSVNPVEFDSGFLVATDGIHINVSQSADTFAAVDSIRVQVLLECEMVKLSLSDAQAVLVSQTLG